MLALRLSVCPSPRTPVPSPHVRSLSEGEGRGRKGHWAETVCRCDDVIDRGGVPKPVVCQRFEARNVDAGNVERGNVVQMTEMRQIQSLAGCAGEVIKEDSSRDADRFSQDEASAWFLQGGGRHWL